MSRSLEVALERALDREGQVSAELASTAEVASEALRVVERERMRAETMRVELLRVFAVLCLPLPDGDPSPAEMGHALEVLRASVAQAQRIPALERLHEQSMRREREAAARQKP